MSVFNMLYRLLIGPLELMFEIVFSLANQAINNQGLSIIFLSLAMNFLVLPLYRQADAMQENARQTEEHLKKWSTHIKKTFKGDERFMILQTYYRQNNYKPTDALKGSVSLLLEIPFFIAAYNFLSGLESLDGVRFGPIENLGAPDGLLVIGGLAINVLPILMTAINIVSGAIYTRGLPLQSKIQLYGMAGIFLVLLYQSPSGLVFYWTLNNLFSLVKNIFYKLKNPALVFCAICSLTSAVMMGIVGFLHPMPTLRIQIFVMVFLAALQLPLAGWLLRKKIHKKPMGEVTKTEKALFYTGCAFLTVLTGFMIPTAIIKTSPEEFINLKTLASPLWYVFSSGLTAAGIFMIWLGIFFALASPSVKKVMSLGVWLLVGMSAVDYMFFGKNYGMLTYNLKYEVAPVFLLKDQLLNLLVLGVMGVVFWVVFQRKPQFAKTMCIAAFIAALGISFVNMGTIQSAISEKTENLEHTHTAGINIPLSKNGKNVVVIMLDRAINSHVPYIFQEKPEVAKQFEGFTYYPNTMSFGPSTIFGSPALYGGYEYTPEEMNKRENELLVDKHNEALKVMPVIFNEAGFETSVGDPSFAGYDWIPDLTIYDDYPEIHRFITRGKFTDSMEEMSEIIEEKMNRNFFCHSLFKISPVIVQPITYCSGNYNSARKDLTQTAGSLSTASGMNQDFVNDYSVLQSLPKVSDICDDERNTFLMMANDVPHDPSMLQKPNYTPEWNVDNTAYDQNLSEQYTINGRTLKQDELIQVQHYHTNMAAFIQLGNWFDYLREQNVYDNTRIILVSDHGYCLHQLEDMDFSKTLGLDVMWVNPLLMVKDFNAKEFVEDTSFMTNADVPVLAMKELVEDPVNPFTGKQIDGSEKLKEEQHIIISERWNVSENTGTQFEGGDWYSVHDNIFKESNWEKIG